MQIPCVGDRWSSCTLLSALLVTLPLMASSEPDAAAVAGDVDRAIERGLKEAGIQPSPLVGDTEFLRRASLDITGRLPAPDAVTLFVLDPEPEKRAKAVEGMLSSPDHARNWARYWRDAIFYRAQDARAQVMAPLLEEWLAQSFAAGDGWDKTVTALVTAAGNVAENGATALAFAQMAQAEELAAETSRLFLGIQIQCAQCHDHPYDQWKRQEFHQLAAFFPRVRLQRQGTAKPPTFEVVSVPGGRGRGDLIDENPQELLARLDADGDGRIEKNEVPPRFAPRFERLSRLGDADKDGALTLKEIQGVLAARKGRGGGEHYMPDLQHPEERGTLIQPAFFLSKESPGEGLGDLDRRQALARYLTAPENPWLARAFVNRVWARLLGQGFVEPVDDMGPGRKAVFPEALDLLAGGFRDSGYRLKWLLRAIVLTRTYQGNIEPHAPAGEKPRLTAVCPNRLSADQLFDALAAALGGLDRAGAEAREGGRRLGPGGPRAQFAQLFGFDPSTPSEDVAGTVPQALFLMNSPAVNSAVQARGDRPLARLLKEMKDDRAVVVELYLRTHARHPSEKEISTCLDYIKEVGRREEALEDIFWGLVNSTEFLMSR